MTTRMFVIAGLALSLVAAGCEEKKAETTKAADAAKGMMDKAKESGAKAVDATKEGATKAVEAAKEGAAKAVAAVSNEMKTAMKGYIDSLGESSGIMAKIKGPTDAGEAKPLGEALAKNAGFASLLDKATPEIKSAMKADYGASLDGAMKAFTEQKDRIMKDGTLSKMFGDALGKFKSFSL